MKLTNKLYLQIAKLFLAVVLVWLIIISLTAIILFYCGPLTTFIVKQKLKKNPINIVVSLTTTPYRINEIQFVLDSILRQSITPTKIYLNVPWVFKRENRKYIIPRWLKNYSNNIIINRTEDYGPATKLIATLEREHDPNTIIITIDDDHTYSKHIVRDLIRPYLTNKTKFKNTAFTGSGLNFISSDHFGIGILPLLPGDHELSLVVMGASGVAYRRDFFKNDIFSLIKNLPISCFLSDDLMISAYLLVHNVNILKLFNMTYNPVFSLIDPLPQHFSRDALQSGAKGIGLGSNEENYAKCLNDLPKYHMENYRNVIIKRSNMIKKLCLNKEYQINFYIFLYKTMDNIINNVPYLKKFMVAILG